MNLDEAGSEGVFRSSELSTFTRCPRQLGYRRILGLKIRPSATMIGGSSIDDTLTEHHGQRIKGLNGLRGSALVDYFVDKFRKNINQAEAEGPLSGEPDPDIIRDGTGVLPVYEEKIDPIIEPLSVQKEVFRDYEVPRIEGVPPDHLRMVGHIDLERQSRNFVTISDHKFTSKAPSQMSAALSTQLHTYDELDGDGTHHVELILLRRLKKPEVVTTSHFVTKEQRGHVIQTLKNVSWAVTRRFFPMTDQSNWWCSKNWCGYWQICRGSTTGVLSIPGEVNPPT